MIGPSGHAGGDSLLQSKAAKLPTPRPWTKSTLGVLPQESFTELFIMGPDDDFPALQRTLEALLVEGIVLIKNSPRYGVHCILLSLIRVNILLLIL